jgi:predicted dehydrogenase
MEKTKIGLVGCGNICGAYFTAARRFENIEIVACSDLVPDRAKAKAEEFGIARACTFEEILADPEIAIVLNLTVPKVHAEISIAALEAGKHAYTEKPFAVERTSGKRAVDLAREKGLRVGCAPDTFLGGGIQTCRKLIDDGWIGRPLGAMAFMVGRGPEGWHPDPEFFYKPGAGPMFDMGPYYLTALINLLGPVKRVAASATKSFPERVITSQPHYGTRVAVEVPTHVNGIMEFEGGAIGTITTSFDVWAARLPRIEVYGSEGSLSVPDPNTFGGPVEIYRPGTDGWREVPLSHGYAENNRGIGVSDMAYAARSGRPHRASGELAYHVLDLMCSFTDAWEQGAWLPMASTCRQPAALPLGLHPGTLDP